MYQRICATIFSARLLAFGVLAIGFAGTAANAQELQASPQLIRKITGTSEKLELTTNSSRILTLGLKIPRVQVNNPELLEVTPLSATEVQIAAKKAGVTQVNLWDEEGKVHTVDIFIYGDVKELEHALATQFPNSSIRVYRYSNSLVLTGFIDRPDYVTSIVELAQDYSPKVINNISVGGVQQVLLKVKVFEVSRTKLRQLGVDFAALGASGAGVATGTAGLLSNLSNGIGSLQTVADSAGQTVQFGVSTGGGQILGFLDALQQNNLAKILAEPNLVAVSGRPSRFNVGGEIPILVPQGFGQISIEYRAFGTQVDFLPIVLGNGNIRLEVRPRVSELDASNGITVNNIQVPALTVREVDTAVEMKTGQTFALAGLIQRRVVGLNRGLPGLANLPVLGIPFRTVSEDVNEIELLIVVTPELVDALEPGDAPHCLPGMGTMSPNDKELYQGGLIEVNNRCNHCGQSGCVRVHGHEPCCDQTGAIFAAPGCADGSCGCADQACGCGDEACGCADAAFDGDTPQGLISLPLNLGSKPSTAKTATATTLATPETPADSSPLILPPIKATAPEPPQPLSLGTPRTAALPPAAEKSEIDNPYFAPQKPQLPSKTTAPAKPQGLFGSVGYDDE